VEIPPLVEILLASKGPASKPLVKLEGMFVTIAQFPPLTTVNTTIAPPPGNYGMIIWSLAISGAIVPNSFYHKLTHSGLSFTDTAVEEFFVGNWQTMWFPVTQSDPILDTLINTTTMYQYYFGALGLLVVENKDDWLAIDDMINVFNNSKTVDALAARGVR